MTPTKALPPPGPACFHPGVSDAKKLLRYWLPLLVWMAFIFGLSSDAKSVKHTSLFLEPILKFFWPHISDATINIIRFYVRKTAHATEYAILAWLWWRALRQPTQNNPRPWRWTTAAFILLLCTLYAASDEIHQHFVPGRQASGFDVLLDSSGAAFGLLLIFGIGRWRRRW